MFFVLVLSHILDFGRAGDFEGEQSTSPPASTRGAAGKNGSRTNSNNGCTTQRFDDNEATVRTTGYMFTSFIVHLFDGATRPQRAWTTLGVL